MIECNPVKRIIKAYDTNSIKQVKIYFIFLRSHRKLEY